MEKAAAQVAFSVIHVVDISQTGGLKGGFLRKYVLGD